MYVLKNFWFKSLMREFFFGIDKVIFGLIAKVYDLIIVIARTSPLSQAEIAKFADRIYQLLAIFMVFKVTFSLIMYVVNPDDFTEKSKGISKLLLNIVISLALLILTPFIFNYAYRLQEIVLEDNSIANLVFGDNAAEKKFFNTAGESIAFMSFSPFVTPDISQFNLYGCSSLMISEKQTAKYIVNPECSGLNSDFTEYSSQYSTLLSLTKTSNSDFSEKMLKNYITGMNNNNFNLAYRTELLTAADNEIFIFDYSYFISTAVGIVVALVLVTYCMDIAVRSIKLAFLQLIAPIPIISYVDPKSGKDGLFKKWYKMCFSTYISLFVRLLVLYFVVFIISQLNVKLVDFITGAYITNAWINLFIIIGALMFAKQFPKILENLGIKLDGDGKFTLNPLKKMEKDMLGGKLLEKPNKALANFAKGGFGLNTVGKKVIGGIDAARHGKGFAQGWNRTHGSLYTNFYKKLDEWAPDSAEQRKNERIGREEVRKMNSDWQKGKSILEDMNRNGFYVDQLDGKNEKAYLSAGFKGEFLRSKMRADYEGEKLKKLNALYNAASTNPNGLAGAILEFKSDPKAMAEFNKYGITLDNMTSAKLAEDRAKQEKTAAGAEKNHESIRKQNYDQAAIEDQIKFTKNNDKNPATGEEYIARKSTSQNNSSGNQSSNSSNQQSQSSAPSQQTRSASSTSTESGIIFSNETVQSHPSISEEERINTSNAKINAEAELAVNAVEQQASSQSELDAVTRARIENLKRRLGEMIREKANARDSRDREEIDRDINRIKAELASLGVNI